MSNNTISALIIIFVVLLVIIVAYSFKDIIFVKKPIDQSQSQNAPVLKQIQGTVVKIDTQNKKITFKGFPFQSSIKSNPQDYEVSINEYTEIIQVAANIKSYEKTPAEFKDINHRHDLLFILLNYFIGQVKNIEGNVLTVKEVSNFPEAPTKQYQVLTSSKTEYIVSDYTQASSKTGEIKPVETSGKFSNIKIGSQVMVYAGSVIAKNTTTINAVKISIVKLPSGN